MDDKLRPRTAINRGPDGEEPILLDQLRPEILPEAGGDSGGNDMDANVGGAPATAGLDSGGAVGVRRGLSVGKAGAEYDTAPDGETASDIAEPDTIHYDEENEEDWDVATLQSPEATDQTP